MSIYFYITGRMFYPENREIELLTNLSKYRVYIKDIMKSNYYWEFSAFNLFLKVLLKIFWASPYMVIYLRAMYNE